MRFRRFGPSHKWISLCSWILLASGSQTGTGQALTRGMVWSVKLLLLQHLSRGEQRQGSVGGASHGIGQIGTGALATLVALTTLAFVGFSGAARGIGDVPTRAA